MGFCIDFAYGPQHSVAYCATCDGGLDVRFYVRDPKKAHPWVTKRHLSHKRLKSVQWCDLGAVAREKSITRTGQDRTIKSHKSVIFQIFGGKLPVKILQ